MCASRPYFGRFSIRRFRFGRVRDIFSIRMGIWLCNICHIFAKIRLPVSLDTIDENVAATLLLPTRPAKSECFHRSLSRHTSTRRNTERRDVRDGECVRRRAARGVFPPRRLSPSSTRRARVYARTPPSPRARLGPVASEFPISDRETPPGRARLGVEDGDRGPRPGRRGAYTPPRTYPRVLDATPSPQPRRARSRRTVVHLQLTSN